MKIRQTPQPDPFYWSTVYVGHYLIAQVTDRSKIWIGHECGEGGTFPLAEFEAIVAKYFGEHF